MRGVRLSSSNRSRWAAIGAAVAVSIGAGGLMSASADQSSGDRLTYVAITPCRVADNRPAPDNVGPRSTALNPGETYTFTIRGTNGNCTIPADAMGVIVNLAAIQPTAPGFFTLFPADAAKPLAASINFIAGQPPVSNAVTVKLSTAAPGGQISIFNFAGNAFFAVDIVGYFVGHNHDDRYYTKTELDARQWSSANIADNAITSAKVPDIKAATVTNKALTSNVATLTTAVAHNFVVGDVITVSGVDATFDGTFTVTAIPTTTTLSYAKTSANVPSAASGGAITAGGLLSADTGVFFAVIDGTGAGSPTVVRSSGGVTVTKINTGRYDVNFGIDLVALGCGFIATLGDPGAGVGGVGHIDVANRTGSNNAVFVRTSNNAGPPAVDTDLDFHLAVVC
jgi:hypothetical protein